LSVDDVEDDYDYDEAEEVETKEAEEVLHEQ